MNRWSSIEAPLRGNLLVEASAGTGKTYVITTLFVRLIVERGPHDGLLSKQGGLYASMWGRQTDAQSEAQKRGGELSCHGGKCCVETACECCGKHAPP